MSVIINSSQTWQANRWITFKLFRDCLRFTTKSADIELEIEFLEKVSIDLLDLTDFPIESSLLFENLVSEVVKYNQDVQGLDMVDPSYFEMYLGKLIELQEMLKEKVVD